MVVAVPLIVKAAVAAVAAKLIAAFSFVDVTTVAAAIEVWPKVIESALLAVNSVTVAPPTLTDVALFITMTPPFNVPVILAPEKSSEVTLAVFEMVTFPPIVG